MEVELEFLDESKTRIHEDEIIITNGTPIPCKGERILMGRPYQVIRRDFIYLSTGGRNLKISFWSLRLFRS